MTTLTLRPSGLLDGPDHVAVADDEDVAVGIRHLERAMWLAGDADGHWEALRLPLVVDGVDILDHQVPTHWTRSDLLRVVSDRKVRPAPPPTARPAQWLTGGWVPSEGRSERELGDPTHGPVR